MLIETLTAEESRVLGTLLEKSLSTPDYYPMTLNALRNACNQKSSRDPVTEYDDDTVSLALAGLKRKCLATFIPYGSQGNQFKYRHFLEDVRFNLHKPDLAVLAVLLLRGAQTLNEVRTRASSLHPIASPEDAEEILKGLASRTEPLTELLPKRPGWKEARWRDRIRDSVADMPREDEADVEDSASLSGLRAGFVAQGAGAQSAGAQGAGGRSKWEEFEDLKQEVADLKATVATLMEVVDKLKADLY